MVTNSGDVFQNLNVATGNSLTLSRYTMAFNANQGSGNAQPVSIGGNTTGGSEANSFLIQGGGGTSGSLYSASVTIYAAATIIRNVIPQTANSCQCGSSSNYWSGGYTQTAFTTISDERDKMKPVEISDALLDAWSEVKWTSYQYKNDALSNPADAVTHFGAISQRIKEVFEKAGLEPLKYGFVQYDEWNEQLNDEGDVVMPAGNRYGLRYEQCLVVEAAYQRRRMDRLETAIMALQKAL